MANKLRIGFVFDDSLDRPDGVQQYVTTVARWLMAQGHYVVFLVGETKDAGDLQGQVRSLARNITVTANANRLSIPLPASRAKIKQLLADEQLDVLHVQLPYSPLMAGRVISAAPASTAVVGAFHIVADGTLERLGSRLLAQWSRPTLRRFNRIFSVSPSAQEFARTFFKISSTILPNVVELSRFNSLRVQRQQRLLFLGRLVERKGAQHLAAAIQQLPEDLRSQWQFTFAGDGPLRVELERELSGLAEFMGFVSEEQKVELLAGSELAVFPATGNESFGIVLIEAMAAGGPVVLGGDNAGYRFVLGPRADELLVDARDHAALADRLQHLMRNAQLRDELRAWQAERVREFDVATVGPQLVQLYRDCLAQVAPSPGSDHNK